MTIPAHIAIVLYLSGIITPCLTAVLVFVNQNNAKRAEVKAEEVKQALVATNTTVDTKLNQVVATGNSTHVLVNSQLGRSLLLSATSLRALANLFPNDTAMAVAANNAEAELAEHRLKQAQLDKQVGDQVLKK